MTASPTRVDWPRILEDLRQKDHSLYDIAGLTGIPKPTLVGYKNDDREPPHAIGSLLLRFWSEVTGNDPDAAPIVPRYPSAGQLRR